MREILKEKGIKQVELAKKLKITPQLIRYKLDTWEKTKGNKGFSVVEVKKISSILKVSLKKLTTFE